MGVSRLRLLVAGGISVAGLATLSVVQAQQPAPAAGDDARFTGVSTVLDAKDLSAARRRFEAGARSAWHSHDNGQLLYVQEGRMRTQRRGQPIKEFGPGESRVHRATRRALARRRAADASHPDQRRVWRRDALAAKNHG